MLERIKEDILIEQIRKTVGFPHYAVMCGIGDDAAVLRTEKRNNFLLFTTDALIEGTHFRLEAISPYELGWKSLAVNLSDIAAMGGEPVAAAVSIGLKRGQGKGFIQEFYRGMKAIGKKFSAAIVGGDLVKSSICMVNVAVVGEVETKFCAYRSRAQAGDVILVTGTLGDSAAGLRLLERGRGARQCALTAEKYLIRRHLRPTPRLNEARCAVRTGAVNAMMDISDGIAVDLPRLARASGAGFRIFTDRLPVSNHLRTAASKINIDPAVFALAGGEDYELLICTPKKHWHKVADRILSETGTPVTQIGEILPRRKGCLLIGLGDRLIPIPQPLFQHF
ncbi:MAG: thiamine-phosphate kinase [bacterium]